MKMPGDSPQYKIEFFHKKQSLGKLRIINNSLDSPGKDGWDFYDNNVDKAFVTLVKKLSLK